MKARAHIQLRGNTLAEVLVALAIISFCAALAVIIFLNVQKSSLPFFKLKAAELANQYMKQTLDEKRYYEESYVAEEFTLRKYISRHPLFLDCLDIRLVVFDNRKKQLFELETTVHAPN